MQTESSNMLSVVDPCLIVLHLIDCPVDKSPQNLSAVVWVEQDVIACPAVAQLQSIFLHDKTKPWSTSLPGLIMAEVVAARLNACNQAVPFTLLWQTDL